MPPAGVVHVAPRIPSPRTTQRGPCRTTRRHRDTTHSTPTSCASPSRPTSPPVSGCRSGRRCHRASTAVCARPPCRWRPSAASAEQGGCSAPLRRNGRMGEARPAAPRRVPRGPDRHGTSRRPTDSTIARRSARLADSGRMRSPVRPTPMWRPTERLLPDTTAGRRPTIGPVRRARRSPVRSRRRERDRCPRGSGRAAVRGSARPVLGRATTAPRTRVRARR